MHLCNLGHKNFSGHYFLFAGLSTQLDSEAAVLYSGIYDILDQNVCVEFFYHMYSTDDAQLEVGYREYGSSGPGNSLWSKSGNQGRPTQLMAVTRFEKINL